MADLQRFKDAQEQDEGGFRTALAELRAGGKTSHWIWYIFPQLAGLGRSPQARAYALADLAEAIEYLRDPVLRTRLLAVTSAVSRLAEAGQPLSVTMASAIDALKLVSSLTLFEAAAAHAAPVSADPELDRLASVIDLVLTAGRREGYERCRFTLEQLASRT